MGQANYDKYHMEKTLSRSNIRSLRIHKESLMNIPLVAHMLRDSQVEFQERAADRGWQYSGTVSRSATGFNPWSGKIMFARKSAFKKWRERPEASTRDLNEKDFLVNEVLMATHDYLHAWAYLAIQDLYPTLRLGWGAITKTNLEDYVFCHLLSEAAAVVGLDYWMLSNGGVNRYCPIGSTLGPLTISYREEMTPEYRRFNPELTVQEPEFFARIARFYCSGEFLGFGVRDAKRSPVLLRWLEHEISYGVTQREYTRSWLSYLAKDDIQLQQAQLVRPARFDKAWQKSLMHDLGQLLWEKVKLGKQHRFRPAGDPRARWTRNRDRTLDFRFVNLNELQRLGEVSDSIWDSKGLHDKDMDCFVRQFIARHEFDPKDEPFVDMIKRLYESRDFRSLRIVLKGHRRVKSLGPEPVDLMVLT